jgi:hypothetical protein
MDHHLGGFGPAGALTNISRFFSQPFTNPMGRIDLDNVAVVSVTAKSALNIFAKLVICDPESYQECTKTSLLLATDNYDTCHLPPTGLQLIGDHQATSLRTGLDPPTRKPSTK